MSTYSYQRKGNALHLFNADRASHPLLMRAGNTSPLELQGLITTVTNPAIDALGTLTTLVSFVVMGVTIAAAMWLRRGRI